MEQKANSKGTIQGPSILKTGTIKEAGSQKITYGIPSQYTKKA